MSRETQFPGGLGLIEQYFDLQKQVHAYFGYKEDWRVIPMVFEPDAYWKIVGGEGHGGEVHFADTLEDLEDEGSGNYYAHEIYTQRFLPKWVYRSDMFTMICVDTHTDGNKFLQIFSNEREVTGDSDVQSLSGEG